jgi:hypothetical protein
MNRIFLLSFTAILGVFLLLLGCNPKTPPTNVVATDSSESCENPSTIMDPNNAKPMALMMRQIAGNADSMRNAIVNGVQVDSLKYPFIRFYLVEPTDPNVLEPKFYENARLFQKAYTAIFLHPKMQKEYYNLAIGRCIACHENYCSGPLKRIRKLQIK